MLLKNSNVKFLMLIVQMSLTQTFYYCMPCLEAPEPASGMITALLVRGYSSQEGLEFCHCAKLTKAFGGNTSLRQLHTSEEYFVSIG